MFYVYIITNKPYGPLYIGHTDDLPARLEQHKRGVFEGFSKKYGLRTLVWYQEFETRDAAFQTERKMKKWKRDYKIEAIMFRNPDWSDLRRDFGWLPDE